MTSFYRRQRDWCSCGISAFHPRVLEFNPRLCWDLNISLTFISVKTDSAFHRFEVNYLLGANSHCTSRRVIVILHQVVMLTIVSSSPPKADSNSTSVRNIFSECVNSQALYTKWTMPHQL